MATPCQVPASKDGIDSEKGKSTVQHEGPTRSEEKCKLGKVWVGGKWIAMATDTIRNDLSKYGVYTKTLIVSFPYTSSPSKFADTDRLRVNKTSTVLTLPTRLGGLGLPCLSGKKSRMAQREFDISVSVTTTLTSLLLEQKSSLGSAPELQQRLKAAALRQKTTASKLWPTASWSTCPLKVNEPSTCCEKGSSSWLNALPLVEHGFDLSNFP